MDSSTTKQRNQGSSSNGNGKRKATIHQSKRQRRAAGPNPTNTWQQQPKIKSASARAKGYINYAGLADEQNYSIINYNNNNNSNNNSNNKATMATATSLLDPQLELDSPEIKFGRLLGGTDQRSRHGAVRMLRAYLSSRADFTLGGMGLSELDLLKLWKVRERRREGMRVYMIMYFYIGRHFSHKLYIYILCIFAFYTSINRDCGTHYTWPIRHPCKTNYRKYLLN